MKHRFLDCDIDLAARELTRDGRRQHLEPKVFDLLVHLIRHRDRVLTREELFEAVWDGREVSDATLSNHVKSARRVLGDNGELQQTIQTVRGRGYQFIAPVQEVAGDDPGPAASRVRRPPVLLLLVIGLLLVPAAFLGCG